MSAILYYSNFCQHSKSLLQQVGKIQIPKDIHFICIDKRINEGKNIYIILENGQKIIMPETLQKVPALLLLNNNYNILYGNAILQYFKPIKETAVLQATHNNIEPLAFSLGGGGFGIVSDNYSFLDMDSNELSAKGDGGIRQMHNYVNLNHNDKISTPEDDINYKGSKLPVGLTIDQLIEQRNKEIPQNPEKMFNNNNI